MYPLTPAPTLIVDTWGFRLGDKDGNLIGKVASMTVTDASGTVLPTPPAPGIERSVQAIPDE
jgi:hypothetical protein